MWLINRAYAKHIWGLGFDPQIIGLPHTAAIQIQLLFTEKPVPASTTLGWKWCGLPGSNTRTAASLWAISGSTNLALHETCQDRGKLEWCHVTSYFQILISMDLAWGYWGSQHWTSHLNIFYRQAPFPGLLALYPWINHIPDLRRKWKQPRSHSPGAEWLHNSQHVTWKRLKQNDSCEGREGIWVCIPEELSFQMISWEPEQRVERC